VPLSSANEEFYRDYVDVARIAAWGSASREEEPQAPPTRAFTALAAAASVAAGSRTNLPLVEEWAEFRRAKAHYDAVLQRMAVALYQRTAAAEI
jgi:hypothetical protein